MNVHRKLWNWCRRPIKPVSTNFTLFAPLYVLILVGSLLIAVCASVTLLPLTSFFKSIVLIGILGIPEKSGLLRIVTAKLLQKHGLFR
jgi:hypothetical protein